MPHSSSAGFDFVSDDNATAATEYLADGLSLILLNVRISFGMILDYFILFVLPSSHYLCILLSTYEYLATLVVC